MKGLYTGVVNEEILSSASYVSNDSLSSESSRLSSVDDQSLKKKPNVEFIGFRKSVILVKEGVRSK